MTTKRQNKSNWAAALSNSRNRVGRRNKPTPSMELDQRIEQIILESALAGKSKSRSKSKSSLKDRHMPRNQRHVSYADQREPTGQEIRENLSPYRDTDPRESDQSIRSNSLPRRDDNVREKSPRQSPTRDHRISKEQVNVPPDYNGETSRQKPENLRMDSKDESYVKSQASQDHALKSKKHTSWSKDMNRKRSDPINQSTGNGLSKDQQTSEDGVETLLVVYNGKKFTRILESEKSKQKAERRLQKQTSQLTVSRHKVITGARQIFSPYIAGLKRRQSPEKRRTSPMRRLKSPERKRESPGKKRASPERKRVAPEGKRLSPEQRRMSPEKRRTSPERRRMSPEKKRTSPTQTKSTASRGVFVGPNGKDTTINEGVLSVDEIERRPTHEIERRPVDDEDNQDNMNNCHTCSLEGSDNKAVEEPTLDCLSIPINTKRDDREEHHEANVTSPNGKRNQKDSIHQTQPNYKVWDKLRDNTSLVDDDEFSVERPTHNLVFPGITSKTEGRNRSGKNAQRRFKLWGSRSQEGHREENDKPVEPRKSGRPSRWPFRQKVTAKDDASPINEVPLEPKSEPELLEEEVLIQRAPSRSIQRESLNDRNVQDGVDEEDPGIIRSPVRSHSRGRDYADAASNFDLDPRDPVPRTKRERSDVTDSLNSDGSTIADLTPNNDASDYEMDATPCLQGDQYSDRYSQSDGKEEQQKWNVCNSFDIPEVYDDRSIDKLPKETEGEDTNSSVGEGSFDEGALVEFANSYDRVEAAVQVFREHARRLGIEERDLLYAVQNSFVVDENSEEASAGPDYDNKNNTTYDGKTDGVDMKERHDDKYHHQEKQWR